MNLPNFRKQSLWFSLVQIIWAGIYALGRFPGVDSHPGYFGVVYGMIHPESFKRDLASNFHPAMVSWYTLLVKISGELWLDDRFNLAVYFILTIICFIGIDQIIKLLGVKDKLPRLAILAIMFAHHKFIDNVPTVIDDVCYRPSTYLYPIGIWLAYFLLHGNRHKNVILFAFLGVFMSLKNGWYPASASLLLVAKEKYNLSWKQIVGMLCVFGFVGFTGNYLLQTWRGTQMDNVRIFDMCMMTTESNEANPFLDGLGPFFYIGLLIGALFLELPNKKITERFRFLAILSMATYILAGFYYTFAPNPLKIPLLAAFAVNRSTYWMQIILFSYMACFAVIGFQQSELKMKSLWGLLILFVYQFPAFDYISLSEFFKTMTLTIGQNMVYRAIIVHVFLAVMIGLYILAQRFQGIGWLKKIQPIHVILLPIVFSASIAVSQKLRTRWNSVVFLFQHGIVGDSPGAQWVGVNEYFRKETPFDCSVICLVGPTYKVDTSLRVRTGRSMPLASHEIAFYFNYKKRVEQLRRVDIGIKLQNSMQACDKAGIKENLDTIGHPDYVVLTDNDRCNLQELGYVAEKKIEPYLILRRA